LGGRRGLAAKKDAELLHAAMKIDANGAVGETSARGDFWSGHAFHETKKQRFAVGFGESEDGIENGLRFGPGVQSAGSRRVSSSWRGVLVERNVGLALAVEVHGAIAGDRSKPGSEAASIAQRLQAREGLQENVLQEVFGIGGRDAREKDAVDHARVAGVEQAEGVTVALLGGANEGVVGGRGRLGGGVHGRQTGAGGRKFKECGQVGSIEIKNRLPR
jgi:hypothetical protein